MSALDAVKAMFVPYSHGQRFSLPFIVAGQTAIFLLAWILLPGTTGIPSIPSIFMAWDRLASTQGLLLELGRSVSTILEAMLISSIVACVGAYLTTADFFKPLGNVVSSMRFLGMAGLTYLLTLWTSSGNQLKLAMLSFGMSVFLARSTIDDVASLPSTQVDYARSLGMTGWQITWEMVIRGRAHVMIDLIRQNAAMGATMITMVEGLNMAGGGLGALLFSRNKYFFLADVFAIQITFLLYGMFQDYCLTLIRRYAFPYSQLTRSDK